MVDDTRENEYYEYLDLNIPDVHLFCVIWKQMVILMHHQRWCPSWPDNINPKLDKNNWAPPVFSSPFWRFTTKLLTRGVHPIVSPSSVCWWWLPSHHNLSSDPPWWFAVPDNLDPRGTACGCASLTLATQHLWNTSPT